MIAPDDNPRPTPVEVEAEHEFEPDWLAVAQAIAVEPWRETIREWFER